ncbi:uncharacterized protein TNCT_143501 [Trichonephila clavata]|uniref:Uncharacterized protein n=1 Tax=Trichonephila clavata TaxID=2740835 RepID=A0A8X6KWH7_TRICU|nr:uncharacterized protein TNCT_143501 [Trichonephila clavata]
MTDNPDRAVDKLTEIILACAISCIPRGQRKKFSPFWNKELQTLKENRDKTQNRAESTGMMRDCIELRKQQACLRRAIRETKHQTYRGFVENLNFRRNALRAHHFLSRLNNQKEEKNEPIRIADKLLTSEREIAGAFNKHYTNVSNYQYHIKISKDLLGCPPVCLNQEMEDIFNSPFTHWELECGIKQFPQRKVRDRMVSCLNFLLISVSRQWKSYLN